MNVSNTIKSTSPHLFNRIFCNVRNSLLEFVGIGTESFRSQNFDLRPIFAKNKKNMCIIKSVANRNFVTEFATNTNNQ